MKRAAASPSAVAIRRALPSFHGQLGYLCMIAANVAKASHIINGWSAFGSMDLSPISSWTYHILLECFEELDDISRCADVDEEEL
jgi:hypothetical protein